MGVGEDGFVGADSRSDAASFTDHRPNRPAERTAADERGVLRGGPSADDRGEGA